MGVDMDMAGDYWGWATAPASEVPSSNMFNMGRSRWTSLPDLRARSAREIAQRQILGGAQNQLNNNRLSTSNPFASQTFNSDGTVSQQFTGALGDVNRNLQQQAMQSTQRGMDWGQFGQLGTGDQARQQAIDAAYGQATSRLDPQWQKREDMARTRLLNQGLEEGSEAFKGAMGELGNQRNDAYTSAMNMALGQGTAAGDSVFRNNMGARQQAISEALKARSMPMEQLGQLQGLMGNQPQYAQDNTSFMAGTTLGNMETAGALQDIDRRQQAFNNYMVAMGKESAANAATAQGIGSAAAAAAPYMYMMFSDARCKRGIVRTGREVLPGVPEVAFLYREGFGSPGLHVGVIAQDLEMVRPDLVVFNRAAGMRMVNYTGLREAARQYEP